MNCHIQDLSAAQLGAESTPRRARRRELQEQGALPPSEEPGNVFEAAEDRTPSSVGRVLCDSSRGNIARVSRRPPSY